MIKHFPLSIILRSSFIKDILLIYILLSSTNLFSQEQDHNLNINLGLYVCENELSKDIPKDEIYGFLCSFRGDMNGDIEIVSVVLQQDIYLKDHKEECIKRISSIEYILNGIEGIPVSESGRGVSEENWLWGKSTYLQGFFDRTLYFNSSSWNKQIAHVKNKLLFHVNVVDKNLFDDNEDTGVTMCFWRYGQGIDNPHIVRD